MDEQVHINVVAVLVATAANFVLGFLWYTPLFGKAWAKEMKFDTSVKPPASALAKGMIFMVIGNFFMAYCFAHNNMAWTFVPGMDTYTPAETIGTATFFTWLGFYLPGDLSRVAWEGASWKLFGINTAYHFLMLLVAATILTLM
jgi:hypothetical protein